MSNIPENRITQDSNPHKLTNRKFVASKKWFFRICFLTHLGGLIIKLMLLFKYKNLMTPKIPHTGSISPLKMSKGLHNMPKNDTKIWQSQKIDQIFRVISVLTILFQTTLLPYPTVAFAGLKYASHVVRLYRELSSYNADETSHTHMASTLV